MVRHAIRSSTVVYLCLRETTCMTIDVHSTWILRCVRYPQYLSNMASVRVSFQHYFWRSAQNRYLVEYTFCGPPFPALEDCIFAHYTRTAEDAILCPRSVLFQPYAPCSQLLASSVDLPIRAPAANHRSFQSSPSRAA